MDVAEDDVWDPARPGDCLHCGGLWEGTCEMSLVMGAPVGTLWPRSRSSRCSRAVSAVRTAISSNASRRRRSCRPMRRKGPSSSPTSRPRGGVASAAPACRAGHEPALLGEPAPARRDAAPPRPDDRRRRCGGGRSPARNRADAGDQAAERPARPREEAGRDPGRGPRRPGGARHGDQRQRRGRTAADGLDREPTSLLVELGERVDRARLLAAILLELERQYDEWISAGGAAARR